MLARRPNPHHNRPSICCDPFDRIHLNGPFHMLLKFLFALALLLPALAAGAADITGIPKIREGDQVTIGNSRIRLGGIDAPSVDQLCLNNSGERWTCGVAARDELSSIPTTRPGPAMCGRPPTAAAAPSRAARSTARTSRNGWCNGWALSYVRFSHDYDADEKAAREAKAGMWQGAFIAPWDWRVRNKKTTILGAAKPPESAHAILLASASGSVAPSPDCTIKGNVNRAGECIYHKPTSRWYAKIEMKISKGTRWFCSVDEAEAAGCRETKR